MKPNLQVCPCGSSFELVCLHAPQVGFVKLVDVKPAVKERKSNGWAEWWSGESEEEVVMGERIGESEMEELVPE